MAYKTIVAVLLDETDAKPVLQTAIALGERFGSHVIAIHPRQILSANLAVSGIPGMDPLLIDTSIAEDRAKAVKAAFDACAATTDAVCEWRSLSHAFSDGSMPVLETAASADLIVAGQHDSDRGADNEAELERLLFESGRPVLVVPYTGAQTGPIEKVIVAWNGSREAARATFDALPFILHAKETEILLVDAPQSESGSAQFAGADIAAALSRHGAHVTVNAIRSGGLATGTVIENRVADAGAHLLVMGAYTHSRLREWLFGGTTRTLLGSMTGLTLMSR